MKIKLHMLSVGVLFFIGQGLLAQKKKPDTTSIKDIEEVVGCSLWKTKEGGNSRFSSNC